LIDFRFQVLALILIITLEIIQEWQIQKHPLIPISFISYTNMHLENRHPTRVWDRCVYLDVFIEIIFVNKTRDSNGEKHTIGKELVCPVRHPALTRLK
jgi:hypothetical protein